MLTARFGDVGVVGGIVEVSEAGTWSIPRREVEMALYCGHNQ